MQGQKLNTARGAGSHAATTPRAVTGCPGPRPARAFSRLPPQDSLRPNRPRASGARCWSNTGRAVPCPASGAAAAEDWSAPPATSLQRERAQCLPHAWTRSPLHLVGQPGPRPDRPTQSLTGKDAAAAVLTPGVAGSTEVVATRVAGDPHACPSSRAPQAAAHVAI